jgi:2-oxoglutarate ferredoxin oxidoreductase subunit beta
MDRDPKHLQEILMRSYKHKGASFLEIYQNCNIFNDAAFEIFTEKSTKLDNTLFLEQGKPLLFGAQKDKGIKLDGFKPVVVDLANGASADDLWYMMKKIFTRPKY